MEKSPLSDKYVQEDKFLNALAEAFRLQEAILNATELPIISVTPEGIITSFNRASERLFGYAAEKVIGKSSPLIFHDPEEIVKKAEALSLRCDNAVEPAFEVFTHKVKNDNSTDLQEWTMIKKDGSRFPAQLSMVSLRDDHETLLGYAGIVHDLTEDKIREERVNASEQKFRLLAENIPGAIYLCHNDERYSVIYLNDRIEEITGYPASDFLSGKINIIDLYHQDDAPKILDAISEALAAKKSYHVTYRIKHREGDERWIDEVGVGVYINNKLTMLEGFLSDITTQKLVEQKLQQVAEENLRVFNNPVNLNAIATFDGYFRRLSPSWPRVVGWSEEELLGTSLMQFIHPDDHETTRNAANNISSGDNLTTFENRYRCKDGSYRWLLWASAYDLNSKFIYASALDITERKKSEEQVLSAKSNLESLAIQLQDQNKQLDQFAHIISHNLRSPVGNIQALINLLHEDSSVEEYKLIFEKLKNVSKNLSETMNDLMDTLKVKSNASTDLVEIRFKDVMDKVVQSLEGDLIIAEASVTFNFNNAPVIQYPKAYIESIFQNLLSNAIKYRSPERKPIVHFETYAIGESVALRVIDNGLGIDLEKYGDMLFGLHRTFHDHDEARGVGLFLIKTQVEAMGGSVQASSIVDQGTTFTIRFN
jgi:PAS domain S-box-containing protein